MRTVRACACVCVTSHFKSFVYYYSHSQFSPFSILSRAGLPFSIHHPHSQHHTHACVKRVTHYYCVDNNLCIEQCSRAPTNPLLLCLFIVAFLEPRLSDMCVSVCRRWCVSVCVAVVRDSSIIQLITMTLFLFSVCLSSFLLCYAQQTTATTQRKCSFMSKLIELL